MAFHFRVFITDGENMVAACDEEVYGRSFEDGRLILSVDSAFYGKEVTDWDNLYPLLEEATIMNLVGEELISKAIDAGFIDSSGVLRVSGVPHAQMVRL